MTDKSVQFRQGDVFLIKVAELPAEAKDITPEGDIILAYGEQTGHCHRIATGTASLYEWKGDQLVQVKEPTFLTHEEHSKIALEPGIYKRILQKEYDSSAENFSRYVAD